MRFAALALLWSTVASAQAVYTWVDKEGETHFTDDPSTAPKGAKVHTTEGVELSNVPAERTAPRPAPVEPRRPAPTPGPKPTAEEEARWRKLFRDATTRVTTLEEEIERDRKQVEEINGMPITGTYTCYSRQAGGGRIVVPCGSNPAHTRIKERLATNRSALERAKADLDDLERRASFAGVPREWRR